MGKGKGRASVSEDVVEILSSDEEEGDTSRRSECESHQVRVDVI